MPWPTLDQYQTSVQHPELFLRHEALKKAQVEKCSYGIIQLPFARSGNFGAVYKFYDDRQTWAVKVFIREDQDRHHRYRLISETEALRDIPGFLQFEYLAEGIKIGEGWFPILVMDWGKGDTLNKYLEQKLDGEGVDNNELCRRWISLIRDMQQAGIAHGDLQHGNILVDTDGAMTLVDYDGMYVPLMAGMPSMELGLPAYQHPARDQSYFNPHLDDFAAAVILLQLLTVNKKIWANFHRDDNHLLVTCGDLQKPGQSPYLQGLAQLPSREPYTKIKRLAEIVVNADKNSPAAIPPFLEVVKEIDMDWEQCPVLEPLAEQEMSQPEKTAAELPELAAPQADRPDLPEEGLPLPPLTVPVPGWLKAIFRPIKTIFRPKILAGVACVLLLISLACYVAIYSKRHWEKQQDQDTYEKRRQRFEHLYRSAEEAAGQKKWQEALVLYDDAIAVEFEEAPVDLPEKRAKARSYAEMSAKTRYREMRRQFYTTYRAAEEAVKKEKWEEAIALYEKAVAVGFEEAPQDLPDKLGKARYEERRQRFDHWYGSAEKAVEQKKWEEAIGFYNEAMAVGFEEAPQELADKLDRAQDREREQRLYAEKLAKTRYEERKQQFYAAHTPAEEAAKKGKWEEAAALYEKALAAGFEEAPQKLAETLAKARYEARKQNFQTHYIAAEESMKAEKWDKAIALYEKAVAVGFEGAPGDLAEKLVKAGHGGRKQMFVDCLRAAEKADGQKKWSEAIELYLKAQDIGLEETRANLDDKLRRAMENYCKAKGATVAQFEALLEHGLTVAQVDALTAKGGRVAQLEALLAKGLTVAKLENLLAKGLTVAQLETLLAKGSRVAQLENLLSRGLTAAQLENFSARGVSMAQLENFLAQGLTVAKLERLLAKGVSMAQLKNFLAKEVSVAQLENFLDEGGSAAQLENLMAKGLIATQLENFMAKGLSVTQLAEALEFSYDLRFWMSRQQVILDTETGLEWYVGPDKALNHYEAGKWAEGLTAGGGGWRLPTIVELRSIYQEGKSNRNMDQIFKTTGYRVWSSEIVDSLSARRFSFSDYTVRERSRGLALDDPRAFAVRSRNR